MMLEAALFFPLIGFFLLVVFSKMLSRGLAAFLACSAIALSLFCFFSLFVESLAVEGFEKEIILFNWINLEGLRTDVALYLDSLSLFLSLIVTGIGLLIHLYSIGYIDHEEDYARFFACLNLFVFFMLLLLLAADLLLFFVGWEGVGLASYLLIGFWYHKPSAVMAAKKAFIVNRVGDMGLLLGLLLTFYMFGTSHIRDVLSQVNQVNLGAPLITGLCLLYFWAAMGKSAQFPLHVWLADAMEGPTPVSALIHAATMVNAGVYLVLRMHPLFELSPLALGCMSYIGALTALFAACCALRQSELKRVLAYSTVSQLGLMFLACGSTAFYAATFHLGMHALAKALLFLSAGNVVHMMHGETDMTQMGALSLKLPKTNKLFLIGVLAMAGIAPFAIFFSKDLILEEVFMGPRKELYIVGLVVSVMTAFYLTRAYWLTFKARSHKDHEHIHEAPSIMWAPISTLALCVTFAGALGCGIGDPGWLAGYLSSSGLFYASEKLSHGFHLSASTWQSLSATFMGIGYALWLYAIKKQSLEKNPLFLHRAFYLDDFYRALFVSPLKAMARFINLHIEPRLERGTLAFPAQGSWSMARQLQKCQDGQLRHYIAWMVIGFAFLISYFLSKVTHV